MGAEGKQRTEDVLRLAGVLLRSARVRYGYLDTQAGLLRMLEYVTDRVVVTYIAEVKVGGGPKKLGKPKTLEISYDGAVQFRVVWDEEGRRRKVRDNEGRWLTLLRHEVERD